MEKFHNEMRTYMKAVVCFAVACLLLPVFLLSFICVHFSSWLVNYVLSVTYPMLTISRSKKIRTLIDTPRNAGIFNFLLHIRGPCDFEQIKRTYADNLTNKRDDYGFLRFPKLRQKLVTCWGHYAWVKDTSCFNINNHVLISSRTYRGRLVNDGNIQDFTSDLVTKYIPSDLPQWQVIVIPTHSRSTVSSDDDNMNTSEGEHYYILVKVHHLLIAEEEDLHISEMLMLHQDGRLVDRDAGTLAASMMEDFSDPQSLSYFMRRPEHIGNLLRYVRNNVQQHWRAFVDANESLANRTAANDDDDDGDHYCSHILSVTQLLAALLIIIVNACVHYRDAIRLRDRLRQRTCNSKSGDGRIDIFMKLLLCESRTYRLSWPVAYEALCTSCHPANILRSLTHLLRHINVQNICTAPYVVYREMAACHHLWRTGQTVYDTSYSCRLSTFVTLLVRAQKECAHIAWELLKAPVYIYEELFESPSKESNILQMKSYSGRKIVSFSKLIRADTLRGRLQFNETFRESDFTLACLAGAISDYFETYASLTSVPSMLNTTCRTIAKGYYTENVGSKYDYIGGVVFLQLPLRTPSRDHVQHIHAIVDNIRRKQIMIYLASMAQTKFDLLTAIMPRVLTKICINFFAHHFPVTITEIHGATSNFKTIWDQQVDDVLLFRPPQSKTCLSLNLHRFGDTYRLAIMADTQLGPDHSKITRSFEKYMEEAIL